ncbi:MAG: DUF4093 domain-containing protein [Caldicoprobacterales bacterium]|jgi:ribonuclease M5|nr:DUF4093 domain-containing protein [Clostridia bacterium]NLH59359.1 DUF4093 domain-containing protein [Clostridiales bacterium]
MLKIKEAIVVEGIYDKMKLERLVDTIIVVTYGFSIFNDKETVDLIKKLAKDKGIIVLTDSDRAGFTIRNYIKSFIPAHRIKHAYIPEIRGKEKRKAQAGKEGILGVEGIADETILKVLSAANYSLDKRSDESNTAKISKLDLFRDGIYGKQSSSLKRDWLLEHLGLPKRLGTNAMLEILNHMITYDEYKDICKSINSKSI